MKRIMKYGLTLAGAGAIVLGGYQAGVAAEQDRVVGILEQKIAKSQLKSEDQAAMASDGMNSEWLIRSGNEVAEIMSDTARVQRQILYEVRR